ncbi:hypothetical protein IE53DRAFT_119570 [Violaceomyces palustris]|uniref:Uncharacterized protein n=1 Tax=Violaceomyces palustris TaxID=1673888 RepID=A0ACD0NVV0_9BASI|nr:hypothetical protein IE53DRAFT_119570 [Violaceomyces palustris]
MRETEGCMARNVGWGCNATPESLECWSPQRHTAMKSWQGGEGFKARDRGKDERRRGRKRKPRRMEDHGPSVMRREDRRSMVASTNSGRLSIRGIPSHLSHSQPWQTTLLLQTSIQPSTMAFSLSSPLGNRSVGILTDSSHFLALLGGLTYLYK